MKAQDLAKRNRHYRCLFSSSPSAVNDYDDHYCHCSEHQHHEYHDICLIACGIERCDPGVNFGPDLRDGYHLHAVLSGTGTLWAGGQTLHPHVGQFFLLKDNETVRYTADTKDPWRYCWVTYKGTEAWTISEQIGFTEGIYCLDSRIDTTRFYELVLKMADSALRTAAA